MLKTSIFIKSYMGDIRWLEYCLQSIYKFCSGYHEVVLVSEDNFYPRLSAKALAGVTLKRCPPPPRNVEGYMWQQVIKMNATDYVDDPDAICFVDSDCVFTAPNTPDTWGRNGMLDLLITPYHLLGPNVPWKAITEKALGIECPYETMRRFPMVFMPRHLESARNRIFDVHGVSVREYIISQPGRNFSEFNAIGSWALEKHWKDFFVIDTSNGQPLPPCLLRQFYSWGGLQIDVLKEINKILA